jgi:hypothetical protein
MTTLFDVTLAIAKNIDEVYEGAATAVGTSTTLIDTDNPQAEDYYNEGTIWFKSGNLADYSARITDYDEANKKYTFEEVLALKSTAQDDKYAVLNAIVPRRILIQAVNVALEEMGEVGNVDESLTTVTNQVEYSLPTGVRNIKKVRVATATSEPYGWDKSYQWDEYDDKLVFDENNIPGSDGYIIQLFYNAPHAALDSDGDTINGRIPVVWLRWEAAVHAFKIMYGDSPSNPVVVDKLSLALKQQAEMRARYMGRLTYKKEPRVSSY